MGVWVPSMRYPLLTKCFLHTLLTSRYGGSNKLVSRPKYHSGTGIRSLLFDL